MSARALGDLYCALAARAGDIGGSGDGGDGKGGRGDEQRAFCSSMCSCLTWAGGHWYQEAHLPNECGLMPGCASGRVQRVSEGQRFSASGATVFLRGANEHLTTCVPDCPRTEGVPADLVQAWRSARREW